FKSRTTKHASRVIVTYALRRSSFTGKTRTSVISIANPSRRGAPPESTTLLPCISCCQTSNSKSETAPAQHLNARALRCARHHLLQAYPVSAEQVAAAMLESG